MNVIAWILVTAMLATFVVWSAFLIVGTAQRVLDAGVRLPAEARLIARLWLLIGAPADVAYNWIRGTIMFRELPRELMFTSRVKRHYGGAQSGWRYELARRWAIVLNAVDPGHVRARADDDELVEHPTPGAGDIEDDPPPIG